MGRAIKVCNVIDEFTGEYIGLVVDRSIDVVKLIEMFDVIALCRGRRPGVLRMDNGPEFISDVLRRWAKDQHAVRSFIPPGQPWRNGFVESFHNRMRDELFEQECFVDLAHTLRCVGRWSKRYNTYHPHSALGFITPQEYKKQWSQVA